MSEAIAPSNRAEERLLQAFQDGEREIIVHSDGISSRLPSPEKFTEEHIPALVATVKEPAAEDWQGEDEVIRAHFLRQLFLGNDDKFTPQLITISCARIEGVLDLSRCESRFPLSFFYCIFSEGIYLRAAIIPELSLRKCLIGQPGQPSQLDAHQVKVSTEVNLSDQFKAFGKVNLIDADIGGKLSCVDGNFEKGLNARSLKTGKDMLLSGNFKSDGAVFLVGADIGRNLDCSGGHFNKDLYARNLKTGGSVSLCGEFDYSSNGSNTFPRRKFKSAGEVDFSGANIGGQLYCAHGNFERGMKAISLKAGGDVFLGGRDSEVSVDGIFNGKVDLSGADIGGKLSCIGGHFKKGLTAHKLKTGGDALLRAEIWFDLFDEGKAYSGPRSEFKSTGEVDLSGADIGGKLSCEGGRFEEGLKAKNLKTGGDMLLNEGFKSNGRVDLSGAIIGGRLDCTGIHFFKDLVVDGLLYQWIELGGDWKRGLAWLREMQDSRENFSPQPYTQLATVYRRMGRPDWAREIGFELEKKRHKQSKGLWRAWYSVLKWTIGYGYKPFQSLWLAIGLPLVGAILFSACTQSLSSKFTSYGCVPAFLANEWIPSEGKALEYWGKNGRAPQNYPGFQPFIYSVEATFPVLPLGQLDKWHPDNALFQWVRRGLTFTGSVLLAIFVLFGMTILAPIWQSRSDSG